MSRTDLLHWIVVGVCIGVGLWLAPHVIRWAGWLIRWGVLMLGFISPFLIVWLLAALGLLVVINDWRKESWRAALQGAHQVGVRGERKRRLAFTAGGFDHS
jgi:hypothetical protein